MSTKQTATPQVPPVVFEVAKASDPKSLVLALIDLCTFGTPYKWAATSWASEVPTKNGTKKYSLNDLYKQLAASKGFDTADLDPIAVTTRLAADGVIVSRWFSVGSRGCHKITKADPNFTKQAKGQNAAADF